MDRETMLLDISSIYTHTGIRPVNTDYDNMTDDELANVLDGLCDAVDDWKEEFDMMLAQQDSYNE